MTLLTVDEFRGFVTSHLGDDELELLLDATEAEIEAYAGPVGAATELIDGGGWVTLTTSRPILAVTSITTLRRGETVATTLAANDYRLRGPYVLERLSTGDNPSSRWHGLVTIIHTVTDDTSLRKSVQLDLMRLDLDSAPGMTSEQIGAWMEQRAASNTWNAGTERAMILGRLAPEPSMRVVG